MQNYDNFINGRFVPSSGTNRIEVTNPSTGQAICTVPESSQADVDAAISAAEAAQSGWAKLPAIERAKSLRAIAARIREHVEPLARVIAEANLKPTDFTPIGNHPMGTCRMSEKPGQGVVNSHGETHDLKHLFVADASIVPNAPGVNPQVTIMALAAHFSDYIKTRV